VDRLATDNSGHSPARFRFGTGNSPRYVAATWIKIDFYEILRMWSGLAEDCPGHLPARFRFGTGKLPALRRRDMDKKLIFNGF
jgi:hypothetical protein